MAKKIAVLVDSSCGLDRQQAHALGLSFQALQIVRNGSQILHDGVDVDSERLYAMIAGGDTLTTSQAPLGENLRFVEDLLQTHDRVFCLPVSSGLSGAYGTWKAVEREVPDDRLRIIDARTIATGVVEMAQKVKAWAEAGKSCAKIDELVAQNAANTYGLLVCNDFARLVKGGRLSAFKGAVATLLKLHVLIEFNDGKLSFKDKSRSAEKLVGGLRERIFERLQVSDEKQLETLVLLHTFPSANKKQLDATLASLKKVFKADAQWKTAKMPAVVACHIGLNAFAVLATKRS